MGSQQTLQPTWAMIQKPSNYPTTPVPGKLELIWNTNIQSLYRRFSPYANYNQNAGLLSWGSQPFYWTYPDEGGQGLPALRKYESRAFPLGSAPIDVIRVSKFLVSGTGIGFLTKQFLLQTGNPYNETRLYNPTSPIVAALTGLTLGAARPMRFIDTSGLAGLVGSLVGSSVADAIWNNPDVKKPPGTAPGALVNDPYSPTSTTGGKGLLRAGTAKLAKGHLEKAWVQIGSKGGGLTNSFMSIIKNTVTSLFSNFIPQTQSDINYRSDEGTYGLMIGGGGVRFDYKGANGTPFSFGQVWVAGDSGKNSMRAKGQYPSNPYLLVTKYTNGFRQSILLPTKNVNGEIPGMYIGSVGYNINESTDKLKPGYRYGDTIGTNATTDTGNAQFYQGSEMMVQFKQYADKSQAFPTKDPEAKKLKKTNDTLKKVLDKIKNVGNNLYSVSPVAGSPILRDGNTKNDYDRLFDITDGSPGKSSINYSGVLKAYRESGVPLTDLSIAVAGKDCYKLPTNGTFDALNTLMVLDKNKTITNLNIKSWPTWQPYKDDLIAFYFYDIVNEKYIPFRASIKGLSEAGNASWEEMPFIGRADRVYSYGGFTRNLSLNVKIVVSSITELLPTWQRVNYICTSYKPANYTTAKMDLSNNKIANRFMVPPMFMLTIGDLYKEQPILIQSVTMTVPDDASWETLSEENIGDLDWNYLATIIKSPNTLFAQLPREVELGFNLTLLEKERAVVGGANFGHAPRNDDWSDWNYDAVPEFCGPNHANEFLVVNVINQTAVK